MRNVLIIAVIMLYGCVEQVILDHNEMAYRPVVNCVFSPLEPFNVHIGKPSNMLDTLKRNIDNAKVFIFSGENLIAELPAVGDGWYSKSDLFPDAGVRYTLKADIPEYGQLQATDSIPELLAKVEFISAKEKAYFNEYGAVFTGLTFNIEDVPGVNLFEFYIRAYTYRYIRNDSVSIGSAQFEILRCFDPRVKEMNTEFLFSDQNFEGSPYQIQLYNSSYIFTTENKKYTRFEVQQVQASLEYFKYRISLQKHDEAQYSDFFTPMEPIALYSNVENGLGIFAGFNTLIFPIELDKE